MSDASAPSANTFFDPDGSLRFSPALEILGNFEIHTNQYDPTTIDMVKG